MEGIEPRIHEDHTAVKGDNSLHHYNVVAREVGSPKAYHEQEKVDSRLSRTCVCAVTYDAGVAHAGEEGRINVLPWYRLVGVAIPPVSRTRRENRAARKGKWSPRGTGTTVLTYSCPHPAVFRWQ